VLHPLEGENADSFKEASPLRNGAFDLPYNSEEEEEEEEEEDTSSSGDTESGDTRSPPDFEAEDDYSDNASESSITYCNITNTE
jgi:hypothetical protein